MRATHPRGLKATRSPQADHRDPREKDRPDQPDPREKDRSGQQNPQRRDGKTTTHPTLSHPATSQAAMSQASLALRPTQTPTTIDGAERERRRENRQPQRSTGSGSTS